MHLKYLYRPKNNKGKAFILNLFKSGASCEAKAAPGESRRYQMKQSRCLRKQDEREALVRRSRSLRTPVKSTVQLVRCWEDWGGSHSGSRKGTVLKRR